MMLRRVFLRVYGAVVASIAIVTVGALATAWTSVRSSFDARAEKTLVPNLALLAERVAATAPGSEARRRALSEARATSHLWLALVPLSALVEEGTDGERLEAGVPFADRSVMPALEQLRAWAPLPGEDVVLEASVPWPPALQAALDATLRPDSAGGPMLPDEPPLTDAERARLRSGPITRLYGNSGVLLFRASDGSIRQLDLHERRPPFPRALPPLLTLLLLALAIGLVIRPVQRELERVADATRRLSEGDLAARTNLPETSPLAELGEHFDVMAERLQSVLERNEELLRAVSHELRTPIARLLFSLDLLRTADSEEQRASHLEKAEKTVEEMGELSRELLELARMGEPSPTLAREPCDVTEIAANAYAVEMDVSRVDAGDAVSGDPVVVALDRRLASRALANVIRNAHRYGEGRVTVTVEHDDERVRVHVDDDGPGIPESDRARVLEPFQRLEESRSRESGGVGLGLAIACRITERHGGTVQIDNSPTLKGARVTVELPRA